MRRMLDPKEAGGSLPSTITFDQEGNRTVGKDLGVDGTLKLKSLVSASNPDGALTKELGGGGTPRHVYRIINANYWYKVCSTKNYNFEIGKLTYIGNDFDDNDNYKELRSSGVYPANGFINLSSPEGAYLSVMQVKIDASSSYPYTIKGRKSNDGTLSSNLELKLYSANIVKLF